MLAVLAASVGQPRSQPSRRPSAPARRGRGSHWQPVRTLAYRPRADPADQWHLLPRLDTVPLSQVGYEESEYFLSGTATAYTSKTALTKDGKWHVTPASTAPYTTRVVVYRPINPKKFDGTVAVEWLNVTGGIDAAAAWLTGHPEEVRAGMAYVGVDAQAGGINGVPGSVATADGRGWHQADRSDALRRVEPSGRQLLVQHLRAGRRGGAHLGAKLLGGLMPKRVLAIGESQSAFYLTTYLDAIQPLSPGVYDGYLVYSRGNDGANLSQAPQPNIATPNPTYIRTDLHVPVMLFETEADLLSWATSKRGSHRRSTSGSGRRRAPRTTTPTGCCIHVRTI